MKKYDLHIHSDYSDGDYTLEEIIEQLLDNNIKVFSITDHDNIDSVLAMEKLDLKGLTYIPGVEFSAHKNEYKMHVLGYGIDARNKELIKICEEIKKRKCLRSLEVIQQLKEKFGIIISKEETIKLLSSKGSVGQTSIARLLVARGDIPNVDYYFDNYIQSISPKTIATVDLNRIVEIIHNSGGDAVLAHPVTIEKNII